MLAGLIFATHDAEDRPGALAATLPFGGVTLIEYQARLLAAAGASQLIVVVSRLTPELLGAVARIGRRGVTIDTVRTAAEAAAKLHPLARVLMLADGLVTTDAAVALLAGEGGDALLVVDEAEASPTFERVGGHSAWAGIARLAPARLLEVAAMPADYDTQSSLVRVAEQAGAVHRILPAGDLRAGHGIERRAATLEARSRDVMSVTVSGRRAWFDRWAIGPIARQMLPVLMRRTTPTAVPAALAALLGLAGLAAIVGGYWTLGAIAVLAGAVAASIGRTLAWLRDEEALLRGQAIATAALPAMAGLALGHSVDTLSGGTTATVLAITAIATGTLVERAVSESWRRRWWGTPPAYLAVAVVLLAAGWPTVALGAAAIYAGATLAEVVEKLRWHA